MSTEPERVPIEDPGQPGIDYEVISANGFVTTHQAADGSYYRIRNKSVVEAIWRRGAEQSINDRERKRLNAEEERLEAARLLRQLDDEDRARAERRISDRLDPAPE